MNRYEPRSSGSELGTLSRRLGALEREKKFGSGTDPGDYYAIATAIGSLRGYWRLGEGASPFADTSGYNAGAPSTMVRTVNGTAMTPDFTPGALPTAYDDGGVQFNHAGGGTNVNQADYLTGAAVADSSRFSFAAGAVPPFSVAAWIYPLASASTFNGYPISANAQVSGTPNYEGGWSLFVSWPSRTVSFSRGQASGGGTTYKVTSSAITASVWTHVCGTYDGSTIRLYINGALAGSLADTHVMPSLNMRPVIGQGEAFSGPSAGFFYGGVDEASVWHKALSDSEVASLAVASAANGIEPAGYVLTSDGAGGTSWEAAVAADVILAPASSTRNVVQPTGDFKPLIVKGAAGQTVNLTEWQTSAAAVLVAVASDGKLLFGSDTDLSRLSPGALYTTGVFKAAGRLFTGEPATGGVWVDGGTSQFIGSYTSTQMGFYNTAWNLLLDANGKLLLAAAGSTGGLLIGGDTTLYRHAADQLRTDDQLVLSNVTAPAASVTGAGIIYVESGALKYRGAAGTVTTLAVT